MEKEIKRLILMDYDKQCEEIDAYSVEKLETFLVEHFSNYVRRKDDETENLYRSLLIQRRHKLNAIFEESPNNIKRFLELNAHFMSSFEKAKKELYSVEDILKQRIKNGDSFLNDYNLEAKITPFIYVPDEETGKMHEADEGIDQILNFSLPENIMKFGSWGVDSLCIDLNFDTDTNWNIICGIDPKLLGDTYICYAMHELWEHTDWAMQDILKINEIWAEVEVTHQHFVEKI